MSRLHFLAVTGLVGLLGISACSDSSPSSEADASATSSDERSARDEPTEDPSEPDEERPTEEPSEADGGASVTPLDAQPIVGSSGVTGIEFYPIAISDPASGGINAVTFLAPGGWNYQGSVQWAPEWQHLTFVQTTVSDPITGVTLDYLPITNFIWFEAPAGFDAPIGGNYQGKAYVPPVTDPLVFVQQMWGNGPLAHLANATVVGVLEDPSVANEFLFRFGGPAEARAFRIRYQYDQGGQLWEEDVSFALLYAGSETITSWYVNFASTVRGPAGELDRQAATIATMIASRTTTPEFEANYRVVQQLFAQGQQQQLADTARLTALFTEYRAESLALQQQVVAERQASQDRIAEVFRESLGGVESYIDPVNGGLVQLPVGFNVYWVNDQGEYLAVDQSGFDPNTLNDGFWQRLEPRFS